MKVAIAFRWALLVAGGMVGVGSCVVPAENSTNRGQVPAEPALRMRADQLKGTVVTPHLEQEITSDTNVLWCNTFQLAWNELCELTGGPIGMTPESKMVLLLNERSAAKEDLDPESYVAMAGLDSDGIYDRIQRELERKFNGHAGSTLTKAMPRAAWVAYAYLFKELPFEWAFSRFQGLLEFAGRKVDTFGIAQLLDIEEDEVRMAGQVAVIDHQGDDDLIVELKTLAKGDRLILAKVPPRKSLGDTIGLVQQRLRAAKPSRMREMECLHVPVLDFDILREYGELCGLPLRTQNGKLDGHPIGLAAQSIRFRLDERGTLLKSEGIGAAGAAERNMLFDKPFLILLTRNEAKNPYFALWVGNADLLVPSPKDAVKE